MAELELKLAKRLEESVQTRNAQQAEIKLLQAEFEKLKSKIPRRPRESIPQLNQQMIELERKRTITSVSLAEEKLILKQIAGLKKSKAQVEEFQAMDLKIQDIKMKLEQLKSGQKIQRDSIQEIEAGLSKVKLANSLGCGTQELMTITMECPREKLGMVIGKQGSRIQQCMATHKVSIDVNKDSCIVTLTGSTATVESAKAEIESIIRSVEIEIPLPAELVTYLLGSHTDALTALKNKYDDIFFDIIRGSGKAAFRGAPERVEEAKNEVLAMDVTSETRKLVGREFGYLLGTKGSRIDQLVQTHRVVIDVTKNKEGDTATAVVVGPTAQVAKTMEAIQELMDSNREIVEPLTIDPVLKLILLADAGKQIKALQSKVNDKLKNQDDTIMCHLSFPKDRHDPDLLVKANNSVIESATALTQAGLIEMLERLVQTVMVDAYIVPCIIGKGGETIKNLTYGKPLFLEVDRESGKVVVGATTPEGRQELLAEVQKIIADNSVLKILGNPELMRAQYRELGRSETKAILQELAWLGIDDSNNLFILRGRQENLEKAKSVLEDYLASNFLDEMKVMDDDLDVLLSGGKQSTLVKMSQEHGVHMSADKSKRTISLRGPPENLSKAKGALNIFLNGGDGQSVAKVAAADQLVGTIIGKGGSTRREMEAKYSVSIHISKTYRVSIRGPADKVHQCHFEILKKISAARVTQVISIPADQQPKLQNSDALKRITQETHAGLTFADGNVTIRGFFQDVRDAVSLLNEKLTGYYASSVELDTSQFARVSTTCRDPSHLHRIGSATDTKVELLASTGEIQISGKRLGVRKGKDQIYDFVAFVCPGEMERLKVAKPLYRSVGQRTLLAEVAAVAGGSTIYLDRDIGSIIVRDSDPSKVQSAVMMLQKKIRDAERLAYVLEFSADEAWIMSFIIGKNGGRIQSLQKGTDCHVDVSPESGTITVTGESEEKVAGVREKLEALVAQARRETLTVEIPEKAIPAFVGHGNQKLNDLATEQGVEIHRVRKSSQFRIVGHETKISKTKKWIEEWMEKWNESNASLEISVERQFVSAIAGPKNSTVHAIEKEFDCRIIVDRQALKITIRGGNGEKRQNALAKINEMIAREVAAQAQRAAAKTKTAVATTRDPTPTGPLDQPPPSTTAMLDAQATPMQVEGSSTESKECPNDQGTPNDNPIGPYNMFSSSSPVDAEASSSSSSSTSIKKGGNPHESSENNRPSSTLYSGTEQGQNLFNLLVGG